MESNIYYTINEKTKTDKSIYGKKTNIKIRNDSFSELIFCLGLEISHR